MLSFTLSGKTYTWTTNNIDRHKLNRILDLFHIISCIMFFASFLYFHVLCKFPILSCSLQVSYTFMFISFHVRLLCMYHILSYLVYFHIIYLILPCTFIYILILFIYGTLYALIWYFSCIVLSYVFYLF